MTPSPAGRMVDTLDRTRDLVEAFARGPELAGAVERLAPVASLRAAGKLLTAGSGGSAVEARLCLVAEEAFFGGAPRA